MRSPLVVLTSLLLISGAGAVKAHVSAGQAAQPPASTPTLRTAGPSPGPSVSAARVPAASLILTPGAQPILRGIVLVEEGYGRAFLEDSGTGAITGYALWDFVGDRRIERIEADRVMLRRGSELVQLRLGTQSTAVPRKAEEADLPVPHPAAPSRGVLSSDQSPAVQSGAGGASITGNGQSWLDRLGISQGVLSRAIETALPGEKPSNLED